MKILIVDDEQLARQRIADMLADIYSSYTQLEAGNGLDALHTAETEKPEIVLMDIRMPTMDGLEAAFHMTAIEPAPAVVFITAYDEHAVKAFEANAIDYLLKPVRTDRLKQALEKAEMISRSRLGRLQQMQQTRSIRTHLSATSQGRIQLIPVTEIRCFRADQKYVTVYWSGKETLIDDPLKDLENEFADSFLRVHRNALVSLAHIVSLEKNHEGNYLVTLKGLQEKLVASRRHVADIKQKLKNLS